MSSLHLYIRVYRRREQGEESQPTGATVRPHVRRAHFHHYWCGPNKERCEVRWVGPVFVNSKLEEKRPVTSHLTG